MHERLVYLTQIGRAWLCQSTLVREQWLADHEGDTSRAGMQSW
jgi:hypothetical protein